MTPKKNTKSSAREYSFRVWHEAKGYMYDNVAIGLLGKILYLRGSPKKKGPDWYVSEDVEEGIITMQWTGLKDVKNRKIYEGDILKIGAQGKLGVVAWNSDAARFEIQLVNDKKVLDFADKRPLRQIQVIGNVHENPELVGGEPKPNLKASKIDYDEDVEDTSFEE